MNVSLVRIYEEDTQQFKKDLQQSFQNSAVKEFGETEKEILPESHINDSLLANGSIAYEAFADGISVGGAIVVINEETQHNRLDFMFVKLVAQNQGIGQFIWKSIERLHPETKVWETCTPYFEKRNIHFYLNRCGFHIVEFYNKNNPDPNDPDGYAMEGECGSEHFVEMFRFEKVML
ncbi:MAG: GNAT family N-acetyltransferase [Bacillota bacterium]|jgi:hypothetical protein